MPQNPRDAKQGGRLSADGVRQLVIDVMAAQPPMALTGSPLSTIVGSHGAAHTIDTAENVTARFVVKITKKYRASILNPYQYGFTPQVQSTTTAAWEDSITGPKIDGQTPQYSFALALPGAQFSVDEYAFAVRHPKDLNLWLLLPIPEQEFDAEITGVSSGIYSWKKKVYNSSGSLIDDPQGLTGTTNLYRNTSNTPAHGSGPPDIDNGQVVRIKQLIRKPGFYETDAVGGITWVAMKDNTCTDGYLTGRDLKFTTSSPPPPPPPTTGSYYCVGGTSVYVKVGGTPPARFDCGPSVTPIDCSTCTAITPSGGIAITNLTSDSSPYTVGATEVESLSKTGTFTGTPTWGIYVVDSASHGSSTPDSGTGNTFAPTITLAAVGTVKFLVVLTDSGDPTKFASLLITRTVNPAAFPALSGNTTLTDDYANRLIRATSSAITLTMPAAMNRGWQRYTIKNESGGNITVSRAGSDTVNGGTSITVAAGASASLYSDNLSRWDTA